MSLLSHGVNFVILLAVIVAVVIGSRNARRPNREVDRLRRSGKKAEAQIVDVAPDGDPGRDGRLSLRLTLTFMAGGTTVTAQKDIFVQATHQNDFKIGRRVKIRYNASQPQRLVVMSDNTD